MSTRGGRWRIAGAPFSSRTGKWVAFRTELCYNGQKRGKGEKRMLKVVIADDEARVCSLIQMLID